MSDIAYSSSRSTQTSSGHPLIDALMISGRSRASISASQLPVEPLDHAEELKRTQVRTLTLTSLGLRDDEIKLHEVEQLFSALHGLGQRVIFILKNTPREVKITLGLMQHEPHDPSPIAIDDLSESLRTQVRAIFPSSELSNQTWDELNGELTEISELQHLTALIGAPSASQDQERVPSAIEALLTSMPAQEFGLVMVADPLDSGELDREIETTERHLSAQTRLAHTEQHVELSVERSEDEVSAKIRERAEETHRQDHHERGERNSQTETLYERGEVNTSDHMGFELDAQIFKLGSRLELKDSTGFDSSSQIASHQSFARTRSQLHSDRRMTTRSASDLKRVCHKERVSVRHQDLRAKLNASLLEDEYQDLLYATAVGAWSVGVYLLSDRASTLHTAAHQLMGVWSGEGSIRRPLRHVTPTISSPADRRQLEQITERLRNLQQVTLSEPLPRRTLQTIMNSRDLGILMSLPQRSVPGLEVKRARQFAQWHPPPRDLNVGFTLGSLVSYSEVLDHRQIELDLDDLVMHGVVMGSTGSGKSHSTMRLLRAVHQTLKVPFLVIDPKDEYATKLPQHMRGVKTLNLHDGSFVLNPFRVPEGQTVVSYAEQLRDVFCAAFDSEAAIPEMIMYTIIEVYRRREWPEDRLITASDLRELTYPTITDVINYLPNTLKSYGYQDRLYQNYLAAITSRLKSLTMGWKGQVFDRQPKPQALKFLTEPVVMNTAGLDSTSRSILIGVLLLQISGYRRAQGERPSLQHLLVIEEAHQLLRDPKSLGGGVKPSRQLGIEAMIEAIAELRAFGQGVLLVEQSPRELHPAALRGTNLRLIHRLIEGEDQKTAAELLSLRREVAYYLGGLPRGQCLVRGAGWPKAVLTQVCDISSEL